MARLRRCCLTLATGTWHPAVASRAVRRAIEKAAIWADPGARASRIAVPPAAGARSVACPLGRTTVTPAETARESVPR